VQCVKKQRVAARAEIHVGQATKREEGHHLKVARAAQVVVDRVAKIAEKTQGELERH
jgi:hypothetical protein